MYWFKWCMDLRWVNRVFETSWCWPECGVCCQGQHSGESLNLTHIHLTQQLQLFWAATFGLQTAFLSFSAHHHFLLCLILFFFKHFSFSRSFPLTLRPSAPPRLSALLLVKYNIYLSLFEFSHPYHWGVLPLALRWISLGLIDITLDMKYAYHDQRWQQQRRHLKSLQPGVDVLLKTASVSGSHCAKLRCYK